MTDNEPEPSVEIARAASVLRQRKRAGDPFDRAWALATCDVPTSDLRILRWADDVLRDAYENNGDPPLISVLVET